MDADESLVAMVNAIMTSEVVSSAEAFVIAFVLFRWNLYVFGNKRYEL